MIKVFLLQVIGGVLFGIGISVDIVVILDWNEKWSYPNEKLVLLGIFVPAVLLGNLMIWLGKKVYEKEKSIKK